MKSSLLFKLCVSFTLLFCVNQVVFAQTFTRSLLVDNLSRPWEMIYGPDNMLWITQSGGRVSRVNPNTGAVSTIYTASDYLPSDASRTRTLPCGVWQISSGTYGMSLHPDFTNQPYIYYIYSSNRGTAENIIPTFKLRRLTWNAATATVTNAVDLITDLPIDLSHDGLRLLMVAEEGTFHFYITTGDGTIDRDACYPTGSNENLRSLDWNSRFGKTLRYNIDGTIPQTNPVAGSPVYSIGHRNALGLAYNAAKGILYSTENGKRSDDELNIIEKGKNYGWPKARGYHNDNNFPGEAAFVNGYVPSAVPGDALKEAFYSWCTTPVTFPEDDYKALCIVAPSDVMYYTSNGIPAFKNSLLVTTLKNFDGEKARVLLFKLNANGTGLDPSVPNPTVIITDPGDLRYRDIAFSPDGKIMFICTDTFDGMANKILKFTLNEVGLYVNAPSGNEANASVVNITVTTTAPVTSSQTVTLNVAGSGITSEDFVLSASTLTIPAGQTSATATFTIINDAQTEGTEIAKLQIVTATGGLSIGSSKANISIFDDEVTNYFVRDNATDLSLPGSWTTDEAGLVIAPPAGFNTPLHNFNITRKPLVTGAWTIDQGTNVFLLTDSLTFGPLSVLTVGAGSTFDFAGNLGLRTIFRSDAGNTFRLAPVLGTLANANNVTVERYIPALSERGYRTLAPSVNTTGTIQDNWQEGINNTTRTTNFNGATGNGYGTHITGSTTGANGFDATQSGAVSLYTYSSTGYSPITNTNVNTLEATKGYLFFIRGDRSNINLINATASSANTTLRATGTLLTGNIDYPLNGNDKFTLITNPYASSIGWDKINPVATPLAGLSTSYTYVDPRIGEQGGYVSVTNNGTKSVGNATLDIQSGQAFFVKGLESAAANSLRITESHKSITNNINVFRNGSQEQLGVGLYFALNGGKRIADGVNILFNNAYAGAVDGNDAEQITNFDEDIAIKRDGKFLAIEGRPLIDQQDTIFLNMTHMKQKDYTFEFNPASFNAPGLLAYLQDSFLDDEVQISLAEQTVVPFTVSSNTASSASDRFRIVFRNITVLPINFTNVKAYEKGTNIQVEWNLGNEQNIKQYEVEKSTDGRMFAKAGMLVARASMSADNYQWLDGQANIGYNYYRIKAIESGGTFKYSQVVKVTLGKGNSGFSIYPNPVSNHTISLQMVNQPKGKYSISLLNQLGQEVYRKELNHIGGSSTEVLRVNKKIVPGTYNLKITGGANSTIQKVVLY